MQVLIVKTSSMGDILDTLPALTDAMKAIPGIRFDWVVEEDFCQIPTWHPAVDQAISVAIRRWRKSWFDYRTRKERAAFKLILQERSYDAIIDAQGLIKSAALIVRLAKGTKHGQSRKSAREPCASWFYNYRHKIEQKQHAVERTRQLFAKSLEYDKPDGSGDYAISERLLLRSHAPDLNERYMVFLHATTRTDKLWPEKNWRELISLLENSGIKIKLPWGTKSERLSALRLSEGFAHVEVLPKLSLRQIAEVLAGAQGLVSVDTGIGHLASALNKLNITLFGPTDPRIIGAYGQNQYACVPSSGDKMMNISVKKVYSLLKHYIA